MRQLAQEVDGFITFRDFYADLMAERLAVARDRFHIVPLGVHWQPYARAAKAPTQRPPTVGYLARIAPEKGFHLAVDAYLDLARRPGMQDVRLRAAGWLSAEDQRFFAEQQARIEAAGLSDRFEYLGVVDLEHKRDFLHSIDLLSVPTIYREPKGLYVLEALAASVPVVLPRHGAFPELIAQTGGGALVTPGEARAFADAWQAMLENPERRVALGAEGRRCVQERHGIEIAAARTREVFCRFAAV
jgi:glycosyltransferase involved in cell wall biosynthesis